MSTFIPADQNVDAFADGWTAFSNFWTESIPQFFTETIPQAFQAAWDATAEWIDQCVKPFFDDCATWFEENAAWLWPVAIGFVAGAAIGVGIAICCFCCKSTSSDEGDDPASLASRDITDKAELDRLRKEINAADKA